MNRNERRAQQTRNIRSAKSPLDTISAEEAFARMTGTGAGMKDVMIDDVPENQKDAIRANVENMNKNGQGPARIVQKPDGSYSVFGAVKTSRSLKN